MQAHGRCIRGTVRRSSAIQAARSNMWGGIEAVGAQRGTRADGFRGEMMRDNDFDVNETSSPNLTRSNETIFNVTADALNAYYTPILIFFGILGNLLSVFVFHSSKLRLQSTSQYLSALALSDTVFLLHLLPQWLNALQIAPLFHEQGWCQIVVYISYVSSCLSAWLVVAFTVERFVAVLYPLRRNVLCTVSRARIIIITLSVLAIVLNIPVLRFATPTKHDCNIDIKYLDQARRFNMIDTALSFTVPFTVIVVLNAWIVFSVCRFERARLALDRQQRAGNGPRAAGLPGHSSVAVAPRARQHEPPAPPRSQRRVTRMLLVVSSVFVLLNLPAYAMRLLAYTDDIDKEQIVERWNVLQQVALIFFNTNFGINFLLYCLSGQNFRRMLLQAMPWRRAPLQPNPLFRPARANSISLSIVANCTDYSNHYYTADAGSTPDLRGRRRIDHMTYWTFDYTRQRAEAAAAAAAAAREQPREALEMVALHSA